MTPQPPVGGTSGANGTWAVPSEVGSPDAIRSGASDFAEALRTICDVAAQHRTAGESLALSRTHGRVLAEDVFAPAPGIVPGERVTDSRGDESARPDPVLLAGQVLTPARVALAASLGRGSLRVARRPTVAVFIIGDGLAEPGMPLAPGQSHDSRRELLMGLLRADGLEPTGWPLLADDSRQVEIALRDAGCAFDLIVVCDGVDSHPGGHAAAVLEGFGKLHFRGVRMQPGAATVFGSLDQSRLLAVSGDARALQVAYLQLGRALVDGLQGRTEARARWHARLAVTVDRGDEPRTFLHACVSTDGGGGLVARPVSSAGTGQLQSIAEANAIIALPQQSRQLDAGTLVELIGYA